MRKIDYIRTHEEIMRELDTAKVVKLYETHIENKMTSNQYNKPIIPDRIKEEFYVTFDHSRVGFLENKHKENWVKFFGIRNNLSHANSIYSKESFNNINSVLKTAGDYAPATFAVTKDIRSFYKFHFALLWSYRYADRSLISEVSKRSGNQYALTFSLSNKYGALSINQLGTALSFMSSMVNFIYVLVQGEPPDEKPSFSTIETDNPTAITSNLPPEIYAYCVVILNEYFPYLKKWGKVLFDMSIIKSQINKLGAEARKLNAEASHEEKKEFLTEALAFKEIQQMEFAKIDHKKHMYETLNNLTEQALNDPDYPEEKKAKLKASKHDAIDSFAEELVTMLKTFDIKTELPANKTIISQLSQTDEQILLESKKKELEALSGNTLETKSLPEPKPEETESE